MIVSSRVIFVHLAEMIELDGDEVRISSRGRFAERDIVQVSFPTLCLMYLRTEIMKQNVI